MEGKGIDGGSIWAMGLMSGTSLDGIDAALIETDGERIVSFGRSIGLPYRDPDTVWIQAVMDMPMHYCDLDGCEPENEGLKAELGHASWDVDKLHAQAVVTLLAQYSAQRPEVIGYHGQTVAHAPDRGWTWQLGDGENLARVLNRRVVWDFRTEDMAAGGQGAPLAPFYHFALAKHIGADAPLAFLNIGGVGNVTWVDPAKERPEDDGALVAFDTGPGNALINDWMQRKTGEPLDRDGAAAARGNVDWMALHSNFTADYTQRPGPKSLDRNDFHQTAMRALEELSVEDGAATLTQLTAECVAESVRHMPSPPSRWLVCGGGRLNRTMMRMLAAGLEAPVEPVEAVGLDGDMLEAQAFAYLAVRVLRGLPTSAPSTTGCQATVSGGKIAWPPR